MNRTESLKPVRSAILATIFWTIAVGGIYPLVMFGVGQLFFPHKAQGSFVEAGGKVVGSALIGQSFDNDGYFQSRPSAIGYDSSNSGASNYGWTSAAQKKAYTDAMTAWKASSGDAAPPPEMVTASGSGLDPHISPAGAEAQVPRVAKVRHLSADQQQALLSLVRSHELQPQWGFLGEPRVNVLELNMAVDAQFGSPPPPPPPPPKPAAAATGG